MPKKLHGKLNLSRIPKELISTNKAGDKVVWIDVLERLQPGQYGETHSVQIYDSQNRRTVYIGDLQEQEFGKQPASAPAGNYRTAPAPKPAPAPASSPAGDEDIPF